MKKKNIFFSVGIIACFMLSCSSGDTVREKQATIVFNTDRDIVVSIYTPIDGATNFMVVSDRLELRPNISITYNLDVSDFSFVRIMYSNGMGYHLIVLEGDRMEIMFDGDGIVITGSNATGNRYLHSSQRSFHVDSIFDLHFNPPSIDIVAINSDAYKTFWKGFSEDLRELQADGVSSEFIRVLRRDFGYAVAQMLIQSYYMALLGMMGEISPETSAEIKVEKDAIFQEYTPWADDVMKYGFSNNVVHWYYRIKFNQLSEQEQYELTQKYGGHDAFGPYAKFLLAPHHIRLPMFGSAFLIELDFMLNEFDRDKMLIYMEAKFPDSEYLEIIKRRLREIEARAGQPTAFNNDVIVIEQQVNTLEELFSLSYLQGHRLYVDIWATWCAPCRIEFTHKNEAFHNMLNSHNVKMVYVSIDEADFKERWENDIFELSLKGYHLLANESLKSDIQKLIYDNQRISVPRYLYINEKGEIVNNDAPRPRAISEVERMFSGG